MSCETAFGVEVVNIIQDHVALGDYVKHSELRRDYTGRGKLNLLIVVAINRLDQSHKTHPSVL